MSTPVNTAVNPAVPKSTLPAGYVKDILVVDDYPANRLLLARQLSFLGHRITTAEDGVQGLALWQAGHFDGDGFLLKAQALFVAAQG